MVNPAAKSNEQKRADLMTARTLGQSDERRKTITLLVGFAVLYVMALLVQSLAPAALDQKLGQAASAETDHAANAQSQALVSRIAFARDGISASIDLSAKDPVQEQCLAQAIYYEARGEDLPGQMAVAEVIINRVNSKRYPNTICGVVFQNDHMPNRCQFSFACDGKSDNPLQGLAWQRSKLIAQYQLRDTSGVLTQAATHYHANYVSPGWATRLEKTVTIGRHVFYRRSETA